MKQDNYKDYDSRSYRNNSIDATIDSSVSPAVGMRITINRVYNWMFGGLILTALTAFGATLSLDLIKVIVRAFWFFAIAEIVLVITLSATLNKISYTAAGVMFVVYAILNGLTLSGVFLVYTGTSVFGAFAACSFMFGGASFFAYATKADLSKIGSICIMALWGIIIASLINLFLEKSAISYVISYIGVVLFAGLTAYDTQKIKQIAAQYGEEGESEDMKKVALIGALNLYLDFINIFLYLLRIFGKKR